MKQAIRLVAALALFGAGYLVGTRGEATVASAAQGADERVFEIRTYTAHEGKQENVLARFRDHTTYLFEKNGMKNIAYFVPLDTPQSRNTLVYLLAHPSREAARQSWAAFRVDSAWIRARTASEVDGPIVMRAQSMFVKATDFSPIQ